MLAQIQIQLFLARIVQRQCCILPSEGTQCLVSLSGMLAAPALIPGRLHPGDLVPASACPGLVAGHCLPVRCFLGLWGAVRLGSQRLYLLSPALGAPDWRAERVLWATEGSVAWTRSPRSQTWGLFLPPSKRGAGLTDKGERRGAWGRRNG